MTALPSTLHPAPRYAVGIDLGTSHCACAYALLDGAPAAVALLPLAQRTSAAEVQALPLLPSCRYQGVGAELGDWSQPWPALGASAQAPASIGRWARELGAAQPGRLVASAKSWLSHPGVDRSAPILPWGAGAEVEKISPLLASASYLAHIRAAWDSQYPDAPLAQQALVLTVPASFDEGARALTLEAARLAGLAPQQLLEEPQAALHDWLLLQGAALAQQLAGSRCALVLDIGGGTTDLTLIDIAPADQPGGLPRLTRSAVGEHLMLGGDNMDLALAHRLEPQFAGAGQRLAPARFAQLVQHCRQAKEQLLAADAPDSVNVTLLGGGSQLLAQTRSAPLTRAQVQDWVVEGFFPLVDPDAVPARSSSALRGLGLPYPPDAAISRHLAQFLAQHQRLPDTLLLNGGVFHASALVQRVQQQLAQWRGAALRVLVNPHPDWAVARGAAAHAWAQARSAAPGRAAPLPGPKIHAAAARSYWLLLPGKPGTPAQGLCLLPRGTEEGVRITLSGRRFRLQLGQAVRFDLLARSSGQAQAGQLSPIDDAGWTALPPLRLALPEQAGKTWEPVQLQASLSAVGVLELRCVAVADAAQSWLLPFAVRGAAEPVNAASAGDAALHSADGAWATHGDNAPSPALALLERMFGNQSQEVSAKEVRQLRASLEKILGARERWSITLLRQLFDALLRHAKRRRRSPEHERVWLNLAGWCLRPGVGAQLDAWRMQQVWQLYAGGLGHGAESANWTEWWVFWRRVAAGLDEAQQMQVLEAVAGCMQKTVQRSARARWGSYDDMLRLFAAMEAVPWQYRQEMGQWMLARLKRPQEPVHTWWAIGRLAARVPLAANAHQVMPPGPAQEFLQAALAQDWRSNETAMFAAVQIARKTGERTLDLDDASRAQVLAKLAASGAPARWLEQVQQVSQLDAQDQQRSLGDSLPPGLSLLNF